MVLKTDLICCNVVFVRSFSLAIARNIRLASTVRNWVVASFTRTTGNVWSNPELTCQHVDPQIPLAVGASAAMETKLLVFQGSLHDVLKKVDSQRQSLR